MTALDTCKRTTAAVVRIALVLMLVCLLTGTAAVAQQKPQTPQTPQAGLRLNDREYFETRGLNVLVFTNQYNGMFFDEKTAGIEIIQHGVRMATGGAVRLSPTPEQWDLIPKVIDRKVDKATSTITVLLRYEAYDFDSRLVVTPEGKGFRVAVHVDKPVPEKLAGRAGLNLEFLPSKFFERTFLADGQPGIFPRYPTGPTVAKPANTKIPQFEGYTTFDDRGRNDYVEVRPVAVGRTFVLAPEDPERRVTIESASGELQLLDGRNLAQNGWFIVRSLLQANATGKVAEWVVRPNVIANWTRTPVVGFSQAGYHPSQNKVAVIELDANDTALATASLFEVTADGTPVERAKAKVQPWGPYLRYQYATADFSAVNRPGLYYIQYGQQKTETFPIGPNVYDTIWHPTADVWFPVQMDHMMVNEAYRVWHGLPHMDDALQAPLNFQHFDGYRMGPSTETKYKPLERIPGLAVGGWFDAGDFDIQGGSHAGTIVTPRRYLGDLQAAARRDVHRSGHPLRRHSSPGWKAGSPAADRARRPRRGGAVPDHRLPGPGHRRLAPPPVHHLGDAATQTDNLIYDPSLKPYQVEGNRSGTPDDRWVFTPRSPFSNYSGIGSLAAASRALRGYNDALADESLALAKKAYAEERQRPATPPPAGAPGGGARLARARNWGRCTS